MVDSDQYNKPLLIGNESLYPTYNTALVNEPPRQSVVWGAGSDSEKEMKCDAKIEEGIVKEKSTGSGFVASVFNVMNAILGSGILGLAYAVKESGIVGFLFFIVAFGGLAIYTIHLLLRVCELKGVTSYEEVGRLAFGRTGLILACISILMQNFGGMSSYLIIDGGLLPKIMKTVVSPLTLNAYPILHDRTFLLCIVMGIIVYPIALMKKIGFLAYTSSASVMFSALFAAVVVGKQKSIPCPYPPHVDTSVCPIQLFSVTLNTFFVLPILAFSFQCHTTLLPVYHELKNRSKKRMQWVGNVSVVLSGILYLLSGLFGYLSFRGMTGSDLLEDYNNVFGEGGEADVAILITRIAISGAVTLTIPLLCYPARKATSYLLFGENNFKWKRHITITTLYCGLVLFLAVEVPDVRVVFGLAGATSATSLIAILPGAFYFKLEEGSWKQPKKLLSLFVAVLGVILGIACTTGISISLATGNDT